jgi:hypothetical protein
MLSRQSSRFVPVIVALFVAGVSRGAGAPASATSRPTTQAYLSAQAASLVSGLASVNLELLRYRLTSTETDPWRAWPESRAPLASLRKAQRAWYELVSDVRSGKQKLADPAVAARVQELANDLATAQWKVDDIPRQQAVAQLQKEIDSSEQAVATAQDPALKKALEEKVELLRKVMQITNETAVPPPTPEDEPDERALRAQGQLSRLDEKLRYLTDRQMLQAQLARGGTPDAVQTTKKAIENDEEIIKACDKLSGIVERMKDLDAERARLHNTIWAQPQMPGN